MQLLINNRKGYFSSVAKVLGILYSPTPSMTPQTSHPGSVQRSFVQRSSHPDTGLHTHTNPHPKSLTFMELHILFYAYWQLQLCCYG